MIYLFYLTLLKNSSGRVFLLSNSSTPLPKKLAHDWFDVMRLLETCWNNDVDRDRGHLRVSDPDDVRGAGPEVLRDQQRQLDRSGKVQLHISVSRTRGRL